MALQEGLKEFNIITLGDSGVGKTSIIKRFCENRFDDNNQATIGINFSKKEMTFNKKDKIILKLFDTCGQERYRSLAKSYYKNAHAALFVFSMNDKDSFNTISDWMETFNNNNKEESIPKYLVGTKNDLKKYIDQTLIDEFSKKNNIPFISTSAKENKFINELFEEIGKNLYLNFVKKGVRKQKSIKISYRKKHKCC
jgi:small GTP-binding protein